MSFDLTKLPQKLELGMMSEDWYLLAEHSDDEKAVLGLYYKHARVYVTGGYTPQGFKIATFPHIIVDNAGDGGGGRVHYTHKGGVGPHSNPHIWAYEGGDALFVDNFAAALADFKAHCTMLECFMRDALGITIKVRKHRPGGVGGSWVNVT